MVQGGEVQAELTVILTGVVVDIDLMLQKKRLHDQQQARHQQ